MGKPQEIVSRLVVKTQMDSEAFRTRFKNSPNGVCNGHTGKVYPYIALNSAKKRLECSRMVETIREKDTSLVRGHENYSRVIFGIFSL